jgi:putative ATPase
MKSLDYGAGYQYAHDFKDNFVSQQYLPDELNGKILYQPGKNPAEDRVTHILREQWKDKYPY